MSNNPNNFISYGNHFYNKVQSFGSSSALDPSQVQKASTLQYPTTNQVIDVTVTVPVGVVSPSPVIFALGAPIPNGAIVTICSLNGNQSILPGTNDTFVLGLSLTAGGAVNTTLYSGGTANAPPAEPGSINGSLVHFNNLLVTSGTGTYPVLAVTINSPGELSGEINCKIVYYMP